MQKIGRPELIDRVSAATKITKEDTKLTLNAIISEIEKSMQNGEKLILKGFGTFEVVETKPKKGRNIHDGSTLNIPAHKRVKFTPGKDLIETVYKK